MTSYKTFLSEIVEKESEKEGKVQYFYQDVKLKKFQISNTNVRNNFVEAIHNLADCIDELSLPYMSQHGYYVRCFNMTTSKEW